MGTLAHTIGISEKLLEQWLMKGREQVALYDSEFYMTPYMTLWNLLSKYWAESRLLAEASLQQRDPVKYLQSKTARLLGDDWVDDKASLQEDQEVRLQVGANLIESLKLLRAQGHDLNDIFDNDKLTLKVEPPARKEKDILEENGLIPPRMKSSLPEIFETGNIDVDLRSLDSGTGS